MTVSPDGRMMASRGNTYGTVEIRDVQTSKALRMLAGHPRGITALAFSPDGTIVATGSWDTTIKLWDVSTGKALQTLRGHVAGIPSVAFNPDGTVLTSGSWDNTIVLWDIHTGKVLRTLISHTQGVNALTFSPDGRLVASGSYLHMKLWEVKSGREIATLFSLGDHDWAVVSPDNLFEASPGAIPLMHWVVGLEPVEFSQLKNRYHVPGLLSTLLGLSDDPLPDVSTFPEVTLYPAVELIDPDPTDPNTTIRLTNRGGGIGRVVVFLNGKEVIADARGESPDPQAQEREIVCDLSDHPLLLPDQPNIIEVKAYNAEESLGSWGLKRTYHPAAIPEESQKPELVIQTGHTGMNFSAAFSPNGQLVAIGGGAYNTVKLWDTRTGKELRTLRHADSVSSVAFSPDGTILASSVNDNTIRLWDVMTGRELSTLPGHTGLFSAVAFSPDGDILANGGWDATITLWDVRTGKKLRTLIGHTSAVRSIAFSPDGHRIASAGVDLTGDRAVKLWDVRTGKVLHTFPGHAGPVAFSPDGRLVAGGRSESISDVGGRSESITLWEVRTGRELRTFPGQPSWMVSSIAFSPDGSSLISGSEENTTKFWDIRTGNVLRTLPGGIPLTFSPDGHIAAIRNEDNDITLRDSNTGELLHTLVRHAYTMRSVTFNRDGDTIASVRADNTVKFLNLKTGMLRTTTTCASWVRGWVVSPDHRFIATDFANDTVALYDVQRGEDLHVLEGHFGDFSPDEQLIVSGSVDGQITLWEVQTGKEVQTFTGETPVVFSPNGEILASGSRDDNTVKLWDVATGKELRTLVADGPEWSSPIAIACSPDGTTIAGSLGTETLTLWDVYTGKRLRTFTGHSGPIHSMTFSPDGSTMAGGGGFFDLAINVWDVRTGNMLHTLTGHTGMEINSLAFTPDSKTLVSACENDTRIMLWDVKSGNVLATLIFLDEHDWAVVTPGGQFDATPGAMKLMHFVVGLEPIELDQLKERYYEPGLLQKLFGFSDEPLRDVPAFEDVQLYPDMEWIDPDPTDATVRLRLKNRGGGIGKVVVFINGKEVSADARSADTDPNAQEVDLEIDLKDHPFLIPGKQNTIEVKAWNAEGYLVSRGLVLEHDLPQKSVEQVEQVESPHLWAIVAGVSDYQGEQIDLQFSAKDAEDMTTALQLGAKRLFGVEKVHLSLLTSPPPNLPHQGGGTSFPTPDPSQEENSSQTLPSPGGRGQGRGIALPTRKNLIQAFDAAREAKSTDILVVYLAGHGVNHGGQDGDYYYLTADARTGTLDDPAVRAQTAISSQELTELIKQIPALKQVLILDTCMSGRVVEKLTEQRNIPSSQIRALERMKDRMGLHILAGSAADAVSYEASRYGQGLLTYSLLLGMRGAALRDEEYVDISKLFEFASDQVPELAKDIGGIQRPVVATPRGGASFDIGRLTSEDTPQIPLATIRPLVLRVNFQDELRFRDHLGLTKQVNEVLRELSAQGQEAPFVFVDALDFPEAYLLAGRYRVKDDNVTVLLLLFRGEEEIGQFVVKGNTSDLAQLSHEISRTLKEKIAGAQ